jgi:hypothetical protein
MQLQQAQALQVAQPYLALWGVVQAAINGAEADLAKPDCAGLFGAGTPNCAPAAALQGLEDSGKIQLVAFGAGIDPGVGAQSAGGTIQIATNRYFFTGIGANGLSVLANDPGQNWFPVFAGLTMGQMQQTVLIHELLHASGVVGSDNGNQNITLGNGQVVQGSAGVTGAVVANCIH